MDTPTPHPAIPGQSATVPADSMRLKVGDSLHLQIANAQDDTQYGVRYLGGLPGISLMTTLPEVGGEPIWMRPGGRYTFRTLAGMHVYAFTTKVIKARSRPYPYAHFAYPETVQTRQVRRAARVRLNLPTLLRRHDGSLLNATLQDMSLNGVLLEASEPPGQVGDIVEVEFPIALDEVNKRLAVSATLRNSTLLERRDAPDTVRAGLEFGTLSNDDLLLLHYFIDHTVASMTL